MSTALRELPWQPPEALFHAVAAETGNLAFLHSSLKTSYSGERSYLAYGATAAYCGSDWREIAGFIERHDKSDAPSVFGYLGYELLHGLEDVPATSPSPIHLPRAQLIHFAHRLEWRHEEQRLLLHSDGDMPALPDIEPAVSAFRLPRIHRLTSNMSKAEYLTHVVATRDAIDEGRLYQANLTRKFFGELEGRIGGPALFLELQRVSPAPYAAYLRLGDAEILSSSPELFLKVTPKGRITSRPIKGTRRRSEGEAEETARAALHASGKDRAENLMIVDLMRNDFSRVCEPTSVKVDKLFEIDSFATLHHMSSVIEGTLKKGLTALEAVKAAFPPGSMTGAPKIAAMRWCAEKEAVDRGVYSGAVGWLGRDACELSVVIRTLILQQNRFEFQVGGGIVSGSTPDAEWQETLTKACGIARILGIQPEILANL